MVKKFHFLFRISPKFNFEVVTHASPHRTNFTFSSNEFWLFLEGVSAILPHQLNVFHSRPMCFGSIVMIQICDSSHMNISIVCFAFWQSTVFLGRPTQLSLKHKTHIARYVLALIMVVVVVNSSSVLSSLAILVADNSQFFNWKQAFIS